MAWSKSSRIIALLVIDTAFFFLELIVGMFIAKSLALVADAFHMLNDVLSLCVGLWAVQKAKSNTANPNVYTYGFQRAETLGALVNGVFLVALCVTIFLEAIGRFVEPVEITHPQLILLVGCAGLLSNVVGLFLFHDHGHGHGGHGHSHGPNDATRHAEEGHAAHDHSHEAHGPRSSPRTDVKSRKTTTTADESTSKSITSTWATRKSSRSASKSIVDFSGPRDFRHSILEQASRMDSVEADEDSNDEDAVDGEGHNHHNGSQQPLLAGSTEFTYGSNGQNKKTDHGKHQHAQPKEPGKGSGHSHGDLNMRGIFLHVLGDALGNIGVIVTALLIWLTDYSWRFYFDPAISLIIALIILCSAIPLCKAASRILLQAVPHGIELDEIKKDISSLAGVRECHDLHVWQLSDSRMVASLHVKLNFDLKDVGSAQYMTLAEDINECLHAYGIHHSTIQPEFCQDFAAIGQSISSTGTSSTVANEPDCLLDCVENCSDGKGCCPPPQPPDDSHHGHDHSH